MRIFICAGEPSGDLHGANLIRAMRQINPDLEFVGFGGERMQAAGCQLIYPLCQIAVMWFARVLAKAPTFLSLISQADRFFARHKPDAVILIDCPGFNWWMARRAHFHKIPVFYFVPPQLWAWFGWRIKKMQRWVDHVLCSLPFEKEWYQQRGVEAHYVGHPFFDDLHSRQLDQSFMEGQKQIAGPVVALLPGSRTQEIENNFSSMVRAARQIHAQRPDVRFVVACFKEKQRALIEGKLKGKNLPVQVHVGRTPEIINIAHSCIAVSGSVGLELLFYQKPTTVVYRIGRLDLKVCNFFKTCEFISIVNLLAGHEVYPEYLIDHCFAQPVSSHILTWLNQPAEYEKKCRELAELCATAAVPGACQRTAEFVLNTLTKEAKPTMEPYPQRRVA